MNAYQEAQLEALGDSTRRAILECLRNGPLPVGELAKAFPVSRPAISQHLRVLERAGLAVHKVEGTRRVYQLDPEAFSSLREYFDQLWAEALTAFKKKVEESRVKEE